jgi:hypothetical protein
MLYLNDPTSFLEIFFEILVPGNPVEEITLQSVLRDPLKRKTHPSVRYTSTVHRRHDEILFSGRHWTVFC